MLADEVIPRFFERTDGTLPTRWLATVKASIESVVHHFSAHRMMRDYVHQAYLPAAHRR
jgi:glucan phosphorylase